jgi:type I restriction enzyme S subunit
MPQNWKTYKLGDFAKNVSRRFDFKTHKVVVFVNTSDVLEGKFLTTTKQSSENLPGQAKKAICKGDLLFSEIRPNNKRFALVDFDVSNYVVSTKFMVIVTDDKIVDNKFFYHLIKSKERLEELQMIAESRSGTFPQITFDAISNIEFSLPPLPEQTAIASILSALDDKIELNLKQNKTLEEMAMALFKHWFVDFGPFKEGEFVESELGRIPEGWEVKKLGNIIEVVNGFAFKGVDFCDEGVSVLKIKNVKPGKILFENMAFVTEDKTIKAQRAKIAFRDILITMTGNRMAGGMESWVGKVAMFPRTGDYYLNQRVSKIHLNSNNEFLRDYLSIMLSSEEFQYYFIKNSTSSGGQANISPDLIKEIKLIHPPIDVLLNFQTIVKLYFDKRALIDLENQTLINQRDSLLPKLISGEVRVKNIEPQINAIA